MVVIVNEIKTILNAEIFQGLYDEKGYTGKGKKLNGPDKETYSGLTGDYNNRYYRTTLVFYNFPQNFEPKKNALYLCIPKVKTTEKGRTTYNRVSLTNPIELNAVNINIDSTNFLAVSKIEGMCQNTGVINEGFLSNDNIMYVTNEISPTYPIQFIYNEIKDGFIHNATVHPTADKDPNPIWYESEKIYSVIGNINTTKMYKEFHINLKKLVIETLESNSLRISNKKVQSLINDLYEIRETKIHILDGPQQMDNDQELSYDIPVHFEFKDKTPKPSNYYEDGLNMISVTKIFRVPESTFSFKTKETITKFQKTNTLIERIRYEGEIYKVLYLYPSGMWEIEKNGISKKIFVADSEIEILSN